MRARQWLSFIRIHQWSKNILIFAPIILSGQAGSPHAWPTMLMGFLAAGLVASSTYIVNDFLDIDADRSHPTKRLRPLASGRIDSRSAFAAALTLITAGFVIGAYVSVGFAACLLLYATTSLAYSSYLKNPVRGLRCNSALFTLRLQMGSVLSSAPLTEWLSLFSATFFSLALAKRYAEIRRHWRGTAPDNPHSRRGFGGDDDALILATGVASGTTALLILALYLVGDAFPKSIYSQPKYLWLEVLLVAAWQLRIWTFAHRGVLNDDPVIFAIRDKASLAMGAIACGALVAAY